MKKFFLLMFSVCMLAMVSTPAHAQAVSYTFRLLSTGGCRLTYNVNKVGDDYYVVATVQSGKLHFQSNPTMKIRTFDDRVLVLHGQTLGDNKENTGLMSGIMVLPLSEVRAVAQFKLTDEQFRMLDAGVKKIHLTMIPINHEREFDKDKIGRKLYMFYLETKEREENF